MTLKFNTITSEWEIWHLTFGLLATKLGSSPQGAYTYVYGPCVGELIFVA